MSTLAPPLTDKERQHPQRELDASAASADATNSDGVMPVASEVSAAPGALQVTDAVGSGGSGASGFEQWRRDYRDSVPVIALFDRDTDEVASLDEMLLAPGQRPHSVLFSPAMALRRPDGMPVMSPQVVEDDIVQTINALVKETA